jgi:hypothetical protein
MAALANSDAQTIDLTTATNPAFATAVTGSRSSTN